MFPLLRLTEINYAYIYCVFQSESSQNINSSLCEIAANVYVTETLAKNDCH